MTISMLQVQFSDLSGDGSLAMQRHVPPVQVVHQRGETSPIQVIDGFVDTPVLLQRQKQVLVQTTVEVRQA